MLLISSRLGFGSGEDSKHVSLPETPPFYNMFGSFFSFQSQKKKLQSGFSSSVCSHPFRRFRARHRHLVPVHTSKSGQPKHQSGEIEPVYEIRGREMEARLLSSWTASCSVRRRERCQCLSVHNPGAREGAIWRRGASANLGRRSEAPWNIGHWPIFSLIQEKRRFVT